MTAFAGAPEIDHFKISFPTTVLDRIQDQLSKTLTYRQRCPPGGRTQP